MRFRWGRIIVSIALPLAVGLALWRWPVAVGLSLPQLDNFAVEPWIAAGPAEEGDGAMIEGAASKSWGSNMGSIQIYSQNHHWWTIAEPSLSAVDVEDDGGARYRVLMHWMSIGSGFIDFVGVSTADRWPKALSEAGHPLVLNEDQIRASLQALLSIRNWPPGKQSASLPPVIAYEGRNSWAVCTEGAEETSQADPPLAFGRIYKAAANGAGARVRVTRREDSLVKLALDTAYALPQDVIELPYADAPPGAGIDVRRPRISRGWMKGVLELEPGNWAGFLLPRETALAADEAPESGRYDVFLIHLQAQNE